jgi:predicted dehydrogenase
METELGVGVIGLGGAGSRHASALGEGRVPGARLTAVCDPIAERRAAFPVWGTPDALDLFARDDVQAVVLAAPHPEHVELSRVALVAGKHVLVEKPLGVHKAECARVLAAHAALGPERPVFGVVHDYRADPRFVWLGAQLSRGEFGRVERVVWQATDWYRTEAYFRASPWRGRFASEGGGLLVNQAPHLLDLLIWLFGVPSRVTGLCRFGRFHEIEVEDDVTAMLDFPSGMSALVVAGTGEAPGTNRLEVSCDRGRIVLEEAGALVHRNREPSSAHRRREASGRPLADVERLQFPIRSATGLALLCNFVAAIRGTARLLAPAHEAAAAVEVANAILWSSLLERPITLPIDGAGFERALAELSAAGEREPGRCSG